MYGNNIMSAQLLKVSLLGVGTVLRFERDAWSLVKRPRQAANGYAPPPPLACLIQGLPYPCNITVRRRPIDHSCVVASTAAALSGVLYDVARIHGEGVDYNRVVTTTITIGKNPGESHIIHAFYTSKY